MQAGNGPDDTDAAGSGDNDLADASYSAQALAQVREAHATLRRLVEIIERDGRYPVEAFRFLQEGLDYSVKTIHGSGAGLGGDDPQGAGKVHVTKGKTAKGKAAKDKKPAVEEHPHHVDGGQLCQGLRDLAIRRWGRLAKAVLNSWNITSTADFGEMVFVLVENDFLQKTERDRREDFVDVFAFHSFESDYEIQADSLHLDETSPDGD